ncbi:MAG TPA: enoyl-CoA hydratase-related protein, partial [Steroidobacteraceae bacterium]|nr:enoyl-CoA hydratase-related protein [Steroidobacteraceae bacterium]
MSIAYGTEQGVATISFDRPAKKNAITAEMYELFVARLADAAADSPVLTFMQGLASFEKPVVAAVQGLAVGIGVTMLFHCDLVYAAD